MRIYSEEIYDGREKVHLQVNQTYISMIINQNRLVTYLRLHFIFINL